MKCVKCGRELDEKSRCCLFCGTINMEEENNKKLVKKALTYNDRDIDVDDFSFANNKAMYITDIVLLIMIIIFGFLMKTVFKCTPEEYMYLIKLLARYIVGIVFQFVYKKAYLPWYGAFIPIYDIYLIFWLSYGVIGSSERFILTIVFLDLLFLIGMFSLLLKPLIRNITIIIVAIINIVVLFKLIYNFSKRFKQNPVLLFLFPFIMIPIIAFNKNIKYYKVNDLE